ncbi:MAG: hypothetical protein L3J82_04980 [Planctomycetes bacterium]|nr:hypothetical protein [Planctomycetota bacterium]
MNFTLDKNVVIDACKTAIGQYREALLQVQTQYDEANTKYNFWCRENQSKVALLNMSGGMSDMADMIKQELDQLGANPEVTADLRRNVKAIQHLIQDYSEVITVAKFASSIELSESDYWIFNGEQRCQQYIQQLRTAKVEPVHA